MFLSKILICQLVLLTNCGEVVECKPSIRLSYHYNDFYTKVSDLYPYPSVYFIRTLLEFETVTLKCEAHYPISWLFKGYISDRHNIDLSNAQRDFSTDKFTITAIVHPSGVQASLQVACRKIDDHQVNRTLFLFNRHDTFTRLVFGRNKSLILNSKLVPCITLDPTTNVSLHKISENKDEILVDSPRISYNPTEGFTSDQLFDGTYVCRQGDDNVTTIARSTGKDEFQFLPDTKFPKVYMGDILAFECSSKHNNNVSIAVEHEYEQFKFDVITDYIKIDNRMIARVSATNNMEYPARFLKYSGTARCLETTTSKTSIVHQWNYDICAIPFLIIDNKRQKFVCADASSMHILRCSSTYQCSKLSGCWDRPEECTRIFQNDTLSVTAKSQANCWADCGELPFSFPSGVIHCRGQLEPCQSLSKSWEYFTTLDNLKYTDWRQASKTELIRLDTRPSLFYTSETETTEFFCMAVSFLFVEPILFSVEYQNGSSTHLYNNRKSVNISNGWNHPRKIEAVNMIGILSIQLSPDAVGIHCIAAWWNSTDVMETSSYFKIKTLQKPHFKENVETAQQEHFLVGAKQRGLKCLAYGEPPPEYTWVLNGSIVTNAQFPELKLYSGVDTGAYLEFPDISLDNAARLAGKYICYATNRVGRVTKTFEVNISEPINNVKIISVLVSLAFILLLCGVLFLLRKYIRAKRNIRDLSETEVIEFFQGRPELLGNFRGFNIEAVESSPYDKSLEIPLSDLKFSFSESSLLGSGEFAFVVRGLILSKGKPVALKISKPSTDVDLFKSLLSEVKIMNYIGQHENVMSLIGVCTEGIKSRSIYIATEICELGSLNVLLRKSKSSFVDLCNANQEIDMALLTESYSVSYDQMTTLDLINYARQIAKGMEYLASKSVIHADLAARNVLVTSGKVAKVSDFGLSRKLYESNNYVKKSRSPLPWRWMAIESLTSMIFSTSSDVWSFGLTLYEIFTLGDAPYPNESWSNDFVDRLKSGMRMGRPGYATQEVFSKMNQCWERNPEQRPDFSALYVYFENLYRNYLPSTEAQNNLPPASIPKHDTLRPLQVYEEEFCNLVSPAEVQYANMAISIPHKEHAELKETERYLMHKYTNLQQEYENLKYEHTNLQQKFANLQHNYVNT